MACCQLQAHRQPGGGEAARDRQRGLASQVEGEGVSQQRVGRRVLARAKSHGLAQRVHPRRDDGQRGHGERVKVREQRPHMPSEGPAEALAANVVQGGHHIASRQGVASSWRVAVSARGIPAHLAVIRRRLRSLDGAVASVEHHAIQLGRHVHLADIRPQRTVHIQRGADGLLHLRLGAIEEELAWEHRYARRE